MKVIVLGGPRDFFSNGIHLNVIQVAADPAEESWQNINAMNDLVEAILTTTGQLTVAALAGNAAAGGRCSHWPPTRFGAGTSRSSTRTTS